MRAWELDIGLTRIRLQLAIYFWLHTAEFDWKHRKLARRLFLTQKPAESPEPLAAAPVRRIKRRNSAYSGAPWVAIRSGLEVVRHNHRFSTRIPFYEGAGSRIRTDDLLITNQLL
jgi:hypothetical protein